MPFRTLAVVAVSFALGVVVTAVGLFAFTVPGRAIQSLQRENRLSRETVRTPLLPDRLDAPHIAGRPGSQPSHRQGAKLS